MINSPAWWGCAMFSLGFIAAPAAMVALNRVMRTWGLEPGSDTEARLERARNMADGFGMNVRRLLIDPLWHERLDDHIADFVEHLAELDRQLHPSRDNPQLCFHADVPRTANLPPDSVLVLIHPRTDDADEIEADNALVTGAPEAPPNQE